jgi:uncharacterized protein involved in exopolysaccharide biosynthesis
MSQSLVSSIDFRLILDALVLRWRVMAVAVIVTPIIALGLNVQSVGLYTASATVLIQNSVVASPYLNELSARWEVNTRMPVVQTVVASRAVAENILTELGELSLNAGPAERQWMVKDFRQRVRVNAFPGGVIEMTFASPRPENARDGIQMLMDTVREEILRPQREALDAEVDFLVDQLERVALDIEEDETSVRSFREATSLSSPQMVLSNIELLGQLRREFEQTGSNLASSEQQLELARGRLQSYDPQRQDLNRRIDNARGSLSSLHRSYVSSHPEVIAAQERLNSLIARQDAEAGAENTLDINDFERLLQGGGRQNSEILNAEIAAYRTMISEVEGMRERAESLSVRVEQLDGTVGALSDSEERLDAMLATLDTRRSHYQRLLLQYEESIVSRELSMQDQERQVRVIGEPELPSRSDKPGNKIALLAGLFGGFLVGLCVVGVAEFIDRTVRVPREAEGIAGVPNIASLPPMVD